MNLVIKMQYSSISNDKIKSLKRLQEKKYRDQTGLFLIEGNHLIEEAKKNNQLKEVYSLDEKAENTVTEKVMKYITGLDSVPKIIGVCAKKEGKIGNRVVLLDGVQDPGNLGTIIRSMIAFHADTLIVSEDTVDAYAPKVIRATQGMIFHINIIRKPLKDIIVELKKDAYKIYGSSVHDGKNIKTIEKNEKIAIIMGNEGKGIKKEFLKETDENYYIPMNNLCESLNVGVALSIFLYELDK